MNEAQNFIPNKATGHKSGVTVYACNTSTWVEAGVAGVQGHPCLHEILTFSLSLSNTYTHTYYPGKCFAVHFSWISQCGFQTLSIIILWKSLNPLIDQPRVRLQ